ncbi:DUF1062 domain-containing protein [Sinorhizobium sp. 7-81]|uniref:DUF1062 domain-containing protein n=1 Tax=Sinorhizobium sp. 8-89 TaxID=3049089 RepID=UPI0024C265E4|nr:DUF1062 domain-containing protein [Sinorhizobium sp. 8-89]MDK1494745.1 DUF1062 domain-containing protein [Sinorhizobium sp. 8-89]
MCNILRVRWTVIPRTAPEPRIACSGCGGPRPFRSSGKIRLNANGRTLDAWLIYRCSSCGNTWNRPIFERRNVRDVDRATLEALQSNDPDRVRGWAFDLDALRRKAQSVDEYADADVRKEVLIESDAWTVLEIDLAVPFATGFRLDRLLARELGITRSGLQSACDGMRLRTEPQHPGILRKRIKDGTRVIIAVDAKSRLRWRAAATGLPNDPGAAEIG